MSEYSSNVWPTGMIRGSTRSQIQRTCFYEMFFPSFFFSFGKSKQQIASNAKDSKD